MRFGVDCGAREGVGGPRGTGERWLCVFCHHLNFFGYEKLKTVDQKSIAHCTPLECDRFVESFITQQYSNKLLWENVQVDS